MGHSLLCMMGFFLLSTVICGNAEELKFKATLTADSTTTPAGGSVTLTCDVKDSVDIEYELRKTSSENKIISFSSKSATSVSDGGIYTCRGRRRNTSLVTTKSDSVVIQETDEFKNSLRIEKGLLPVVEEITIH
ncbi:uncharacterized protein LOC109200888 isoform X2 [Oreochromis niloticus]|uniref:uncharacterized protein LOC109200888 isoform X2 n=1 Tax=Oreochromis niloticus TaxID=8128 RepID=UPI000DF3EA0E|nr:uncharacterized protein LOC109200888 isoform X2 [Oreochromis niloticus]